MDFIDDYREQEDELSTVLGVKSVTIDPKKLTRFQFDDFVALANTQIEMNPQEVQANQDMMTAMGVFCMMWMCQLVQPQITLTPELLSSIPRDMGITGSKNENGNWTFSLINMETEQPYNIGKLIEYAADSLKGEYDTNNSFSASTKGSSGGDSRE